MNVDSGALLASRTGSRKASDTTFQPKAGGACGRRAAIAPCMLEASCGLTQRCSATATQRTTARLAEIDQRSSPAAPAKRGIPSGRGRWRRSRRDSDLATARSCRDRADFVRAMSSGIARSAALDAGFSSPQPLGRRWAAPNTMVVSVADPSHSRSPSGAASTLGDNRIRRAGGGNAVAIVDTRRRYGALAAQDDGGCGRCAGLGHDHTGSK